MIKFETVRKASPETVGLCRQAWSRLLNRTDLGYWQIPNRDENWRIAESFAQELKAQASVLKVLGLGGSALGGRCLVSSLGDASRVGFLYNSDPVTVDEFFRSENEIAEAHYLFISKSGNTLELACLLEILAAKLKKRNRALSSAISVITEEKPSPLFDWATRNKVRIVPHPLDVGGRFSAFTPVGLVPAVFSGIPIDKLRLGTRAALEDQELAVQLAAFYVESFKRSESISVFWSYSDQLATFLPWLVQLWAESLAKLKGRNGQMGPSVSTPLGYLGTCDQHSVLQQLMEGARDKSVCFIRDRSLENRGPSLSGEVLPQFEYLKGLNLGHVFQTQSRSTEEALRAAERTTLSLELESVNAESVAKLMMTFELVIGILGEALDINAFDQPGVELGKKITKEKLQKSARI